MGEVKRKHPLAKCEECPLYQGGKYVPSDYQGNKTAEYVLLGEAPGGMEAKVGKPFVGMSGKLLDATLEEMGVDKRQAVLTNTCLCRPPANETPTPAAVKACKPALKALLEEVQPKYVVAMGNTAASAMLGRGTRITQDRVGPPKEVGKPYKLIPTVHPAACLRNPNLFPMLAADLQKLKPGATKQWKTPVYKVYDDETSACRAIAQLKAAKAYDVLVVDLEVGEEKDNSFGHPNTLLAVGIAYKSDTAIVIGAEAVKSATVRKALSDLFQYKKLVCHNGKYDLGVLYRMGFGTFKLYRDTMLMAYTIDEVPGTKGLKYLAKELLGAPDWDLEIKQYTTGKDGSWSKIPKDILYKYNAYDVNCTWDLLHLLPNRMDENDWKLHAFLCRASDALMLIESDGIYIDQEELERLSVEMEINIADKKRLLQKFAAEYINKLTPKQRELVEKGGGFNPNSPLQVAGLLKAISGITFTTTDADTLSKLVNKGGPLGSFAKDMLYYRKITKLYGTYVKGTSERIDDDGRVRTSYLLHGTETGRLSARNPNVQNVPRTNEYGNIRKVYAASPGHRFVYADYSNIEGRVVAVLSGDEKMIELMQDPDSDIHSTVAQSIFGPTFTKDNRFVAKSVVHGANYARTAHGIAEGLDIAVPEATRVYNGYHKLFPKVKPWHAAIKHQVLNTDEPLITPYGRKRRFALIIPDNSEDVYKEGLAFKPQSIASDICLSAAVQLKEEGFAVRLLVHDGIGIEVPVDEVEAAVARIREVMMERARDFTTVVPFYVDIQVGASWGEVD
jgi:uracil-DNA glycosylase family 4